MRLDLYQVSLATLRGRVDILVSERAFISVSSRYIVKDCIYDIHVDVIRDMDL